MKTLTATRPKLGFLGLGWIGKNRLRAIKKHQSAEIQGAVDPDASAIEELGQEIPNLQKYKSFEAMLEDDLDGIVIATPSALHAQQALMALKKGKAVFCQKPLGRNKQETDQVVNEARKRNLLLGVDFSYRHTGAAKQVKKIVQSGKLGRIYSVQLTFHNAYGPNKSWYYNRSLSGGGCLMDLGVHLIDLLFWMLNETEIQNMNSQIFQKGRPINDRANQIEDYAAAQFTLNNRAVVQLSCSWDLSVGKNAVIEVNFYGEHGGAAFRNVDGSFYDFIAEKYTGTSSQVLAKSPDDWEGRAIVKWSDKLAEGNKFDTAAEMNINVAHALDLIYKNGSK